MSQYRNSAVKTKEKTMTRDPSQSGRRRFIKISTAALAAAPLANVLLSGAAQAAETLSESDPTATALGYKTDATKAPKRTDKTAFCSNCNLFSGKAGAADGPCSIFGGKLVNAKGWCTAWVKKA
jgi:high potential iron-sulfur protein